MTDLAARFWAKVRKTKTCWLWTGGSDQNGYGQIQVKLAGTWRPVRSHRVAFFLEHGRWPANGLHGCDNPRCVRVAPGHVFEGTKADNTADMLAKGRGYQQPPATVCQRGHQMAGWNVRVASGKRRCRACENAAQKRRRAA